MHLNRRDPAQKRSRYLWRGVREREQVTSDQISIRMQQSSLFLSFFPSSINQLTSNDRNDDEEDNDNGPFRCAHSSNGADSRRWEYDPCSAVV